MPRTVVALALTLTLAAAPARAMSFEVREGAAGPVVVASGEVADGDAERLRTALRRAGRVHEVWFTGGGSTPKHWDAGLELGRALRESGFAARVPDGATCMDACVFAFLGGILRRVDGRSTVGMHRFTAASNPEMIALITRQVSGGGADAVDTIVRRYEENFSAGLYRRVLFLLEHSVSLRLMTDIYEGGEGATWTFTPSEIADYNVANVR